MYSYNDQAVVIRRSPFGEADYILTLFTRNHGKVKVVGKGVRKITSRRGGHLDLFNYLELQIRKTRGMGIVTEANVLRDFSGAKSSLVTVQKLYYVAELLDSLFLEEKKYYKVFKRLLELLEKIEESDEGLGRALRDFEVMLLKELGYWSEEVQGAKYPRELDKRRKFNQMLLRDLTGREFKTLDSDLL